MNKAAVWRTVRDVSVVAVVTGVMTLSLLVVGGLLLAPELSKVFGNVEGECRGAQTPTQVLDHWAALGSEDVWTTPEPSMSWFPYGTRCTWTLTDGSTVSQAASWDKTLTMAGALAVVGGAVVLLARSGTRPERAPAPS